MQPIQCEFEFKTMKWWTQNAKLFSQKKKQKDGKEWKLDIRWEEQTVKLDVRRALIERLQPSTAYYFHVKLTRDEKHQVCSFKMIKTMSMIFSRCITRVPPKVIGPTTCFQRCFSSNSPLCNSCNSSIPGECLFVQPEGGDHRCDHRHRHPSLHPRASLCQEKRGTYSRYQCPDCQSNFSGDRLLGWEEKKERGTWVLRLQGWHGNQIFLTSVQLVPGKCLTMFN